MLAKIGQRPDQTGVATQAPDVGDRQADFQNKYAQFLHMAHLGAAGQSPSDTTGNLFTNERYRPTVTDGHGDWAPIHRPPGFSEAQGQARDAHTAQMEAELMRVRGTGR